MTPAATSSSTWCWHCVALGAVAFVALQPGFDAAAQASAIPILVTGINAEAAGIGDTGIGSLQSAFSSFWNPAGVADSRLPSARERYDGSTRAGSSSELGIAHHIWVRNTRTYGLAGRFGFGGSDRGKRRGTASSAREAATSGPQRSSGVAVFLIASDAGDDDGVEAGGTGDAQYFTAGATYAVSIGLLQIGLSGKYVSQNISSLRSRGVAVDGGAILDLHDQGIRLGVSLLNVGRLSEVEAVLTELPTTLRFGLAVFPFKIVAIDDGFPLLDLLFAVEVERNVRQEQTRLHVGVSGVLLETIVARAGYITNDDLRGPTVGLGLSYEAFNFDYAVVPFSDGFGGPGHILTLTYGW